MDTPPAAFRRALRTSPLRRRRLFLENLEPRQLLATFAVNTTADTVDAIPGDGLAQDASGNTSLRAAIMEANATGAHDVIQLPAGRFELTITGIGEDFARTGDLDLRQRLEITGVSASETIIDANGLDRVFDGLNRSFDPSNPVPVYLSRLTITGGDSGIDGGAGLVNRGHAILTDVVFQGNRAGGVGGAISNADSFANLLVTGGAFIGNESDRWGGAVYNNGATLSVSGATFSGNHANILGGAIYTRSGSFTLVNSLIEENTAGDTGGAIYSLTFGASIQTSTLRGNSAVTGGAIWAGDKLVLSRSTVSGNSAAGDGGGLHLAGSVNQPHSITNSTIAGNTAINGGGIFNASWLELASSTISANGGSLGGGIHTSFGTTTSTSVNSIFAGNTAPTSPDQFGFITSLGFNLVGNGTRNFGFSKPGDMVGTPISPLDPRLGPLQDNGGPTFTLALLASSPALDAGTNNGAPVIDQRGFLRPDNGVTDIGAFELQVGNVPPVASNLTLGAEEDAPQNGQVSATDADGDALTFAVVNQPAHGTVSMAADGSFTYAPAADYFGSDSFTFRANDGLANSNTATVSLTIVAINDPPIANDDAYSVDEDGLLIVGGANAGTPLLRYSFDEAQNGTATAIDSGLSPATNGTYVGGATRVGITPGTNSLAALDVSGAPGGSHFVTAGDTPDIDATTAMTITTWINLRDDPEKDDALLANVPVPASADGDIYSGWVWRIVGTGSGDPTAASFGLQLYAFEKQSDRSSSWVARTPAVINADGIWAFVAITVDPLDGGVNPNSVAMAMYHGSERSPVAALPISKLGLTVFGELFGFVPNSLSIGGYPSTAGGVSVDHTPPAWMDEVRIYDRVLTPEEIENVRLESALLADGVLLNDADVDNDLLSAELVSGPQHGTLDFSETGAFVYTPDADYHGSDAFVYRATDGLASDLATVVIAVKPVNDVPTAANADLSTSEDAAASGTLSATDVDGDALLFAVVSPPTHGTVAVDSGGSFTYTPAANYHGPDSFTFKANDGAADSNLATVSITVAPVNDAPAAANAAIVTDEDTAKAGQVIATDADGDALTYALVAGPSHGAVAVDADGSFLYTPAANYHGPDSFTLKANDGAADSNTATVSITVTPVNDAPVAAGGTLTTDEDTAASGNLLATDIDGDALSFSLVGAAIHGTAVVNADGSYTYTPAANYHGSDSFAFQANDGSTDSNVATVSITLNPVNDAPVAANATLVTDEDTASSGQLVATDVDGDALTYALVAGTTHGTIVLNADGSYSFTPAANYHGSDSFKFKANDSNADSNVATVSITVNSVNDAPLASDAAGTLPENSPVGTAVAAVNASDVDADQTLSFAITAGNDGGEFAIDAAGNITVASSAALDYESQQQWVLTVEVRDNGTPELADLATVTIDLTNVIETTIVPIDILPGKSPNVIDVRKGGKVSVAILSTAEFDAATMVDVESLTFGRTGDELSLVRRGKLRTPVVSVQDVNGDGRLDLVPQFDVALTGFQAGDTEGILRGRIIGGELLEGRDSVEIRAGGGKNSSAANWAIAVDAFYAQLADSTTGKKRARYR